MHTYLVHTSAPCLLWEIGSKAYDQIKFWLANLKDSLPHAGSYRIFHRVCNFCLTGVCDFRLGQPIKSRSRKARAGGGTNHISSHSITSLLILCCLIYGHRYKNPIFNKHVTRSCWVSVFLGNCCVFSKKKLLKGPFCDAKMLFFKQYIILKASS